MSKQADNIEPVGDGKFVESKHFEELEGCVEKLKEYVEGLDKKYSNQESWKKFLENKFLNKRTLPVFLWFVAAMFLGYKVCCLTNTYIAEQRAVLTYIEKQQDKGQLKDTLNVPQDIGEIKTDNPHLVPSVTFEAGDIKYNSKGNHNPSQSQTPYSQLLFSLTYLCTLFVVALVVMVLVPLRYILRKHDDYY